MLMGNLMEDELMWEKFLVNNLKPHFGKDLVSIVKLFQLILIEENFIKIQYCLYFLISRVEERRHQNQDKKFI